jgi:hypothetical protein
MVLTVCNILSKPLWLIGMIFLIEAVLRKNAYVAVVYCLFVLKHSSAFDGCVGENIKESK